jgi:hypothetical protein
LPPGPLALISVPAVFVPLTWSQRPPDMNKVWPVGAAEALTAFTDALTVSPLALSDGIEGPREDHRCDRCALCSVPLARPPVVGALVWPGTARALWTVHAA